MPKCPNVLPYAEVWPWNSQVVGFGHGNALGKLIKRVWKRKSRNHKKIETLVVREWERNQFRESFECLVRVRDKDITTNFGGCGNQIHLLAREVESEGGKLCTVSCFAMGEAASHFRLTKPCTHWRPGRRMGCWSTWSQLLDVGRHSARFFHGLHTQTPSNTFKLSSSNL